MAEEKLSCVDCAIKACRGKGGEYPAFCPTRHLDPQLLEEAMEQVVCLSVPLTAEAHWGRNWLEAKG